MTKEAPEITRGDQLRWRLVPNLVAGVEHYRLDGEKVDGSYLSFFGLDKKQIAELYHARTDDYPVRFGTKQTLVAGLIERGLPSPVTKKAIPLPE